VNKEHLDIVFRPQKPGNHHIEVLVGAPPVMCSQLDFYVTSPPVCDWSVFKSGYRVGEKVILPILKSSFGLKIGSNTGLPPIEGFIRQLGGLNGLVYADQSFEVTFGAENVYIEFLAKSFGKHEAHVTLNGNHIPGSPYLFELLPPAEVALDFPGGTRGEVGEIFSCTAHSTKGEQGLFFVVKASMELNGKTVEIEVPCENVVNGVFTFSYIPYVAGRHYITVYDLNGDAILKRDILICGPDPQQTEVSWEILKLSAIGEWIIIPVKLRNSKGRLVSLNGSTLEAVVLQLDNDSRIRTEVQTTAGGESQVIFWPTIAGKYSISLAIDGKQVNDSPYGFSLSIPELPTKVIWESMDGKNIDEELSFLIEPKQVGEVENISVLVEWGDTANGAGSASAVVDIKLKEMKANTYQVAFKVPTPGDVVIRVRVDGHEVTKYACVVLPTPNANTPLGKKSRKNRASAPPASAASTGVPKNRSSAPPQIPSPSTLATVAEPEQKPRKVKGNKKRLLKIQKALTALFARHKSKEKDTTDGNKQIIVQQ